MNLSSPLKAVVSVYRKICVGMMAVPVLRSAASALVSRTFRPYHAQHGIARISVRGFVSHKADVSHSALRMGAHVFIGPSVVLYEHGGGSITLGDRVRLNSGTYLETGSGGSIYVGHDVDIHHDCHIASYREGIMIGRGALLAPRCALYSFDHGYAGLDDIRFQSKVSKGPIVIGSGVWLGYGVIVVSGVTIGEGAVVGAGSVVTSNVPPYSVAAGNPARVIKWRQNAPKV